MPLILKVTRYKGQPVSSEIMASFDEFGGSIGRSPDNYFVLNDPENIISRKHASIVFLDGAYSLSDTSSNGTYFINRNFLLLNNTIELRDRDLLKIGNYEIEVYDGIVSAPSIPIKSKKNTQFTLDIERYLAEVAPNNICGTYLGYAQEFIELEEAIKGKSEQQLVGSIREAEPPNWREVRKKSEELLSRTRDLRVLICLLRALIATEGLSGLDTGLFLIKKLVEHFWDCIHPQLDSEDDNDPTERVNILMSLCDHETILRPLQLVPLVESITLGKFTLRDLSIATNTGNVEVLRTIEEAVKDSDLESLQRTYDAIVSSLDHINRLENIVTEYVDINLAPDFSKLRELLKKVESQLGAWLDSKRSVESPCGAEGSMDHKNPFNDIPDFIEPFYEIPECSAPAESLKPYKYIDDENWDWVAEFIQPKTDEVYLALSSPRVLKPNSCFITRFAAYTLEYEAEIRQKIEIADRGRTEFIPQPETCRWQLGAPILVRVTGDWFTVKPTEQSFKWDGCWAIKSFQISPKPETPIGLVQLCIEVWVADFCETWLWLELEISNESNQSTEMAETIGKPMRQAFASYASADLPEVLARISAITAWDKGLNIFHDWLDLTEGEDWKERLKNELYQREVLLLFWSTKAKESKWVDWEWRTMLHVKGVTAIQPIPIEPPEIAIPPEELAPHLNFRDRYLVARQAAIRIAELKAEMEGN